MCWITGFSFSTEKDNSSIGFFSKKHNFNKLPNAKILKNINLTNIARLAHSNLRKINKRPDSLRNYIYTVFVIWILPKFVKNRLIVKFYIYVIKISTLCMFNITDVHIQCLIKWFIYFYIHWFIFLPLPHFWQKFASCKQLWPQFPQNMMINAICIYIPNASCN